MPRFMHSLRSIITDLEKVRWNYPDGGDILYYIIPA